MMKLKIFLPLFILLLSWQINAQTLSNKFSAAINKLEKDPVFIHSLIGIEILDAVSGKSIYSYNADKGMVPASTQKIITATAMLEKFGPGFRFKTSFFLKKFSSGSYTLSVVGNCDPSLGSYRWNETLPHHILKGLVAKLKEAGVTHIDTVQIFNPLPGYNIPENWVWEDLGNYYGATAERLNWRENQFDVHLQSADGVGNAVSILHHNGPAGIKFISELSTGEKGSGDQAYIFHAANDSITFIRGTIPPSENDFLIKASVFGPGAFFSDLVKDSSGIFEHAVEKLETGESEVNPGLLIFENYSPTLDKLVYWFLKKSINLYGECFLQQLGNGRRKDGLDSINSILSGAGIDMKGMIMFDGSGLSPGNRVSPKMLAEVLAFAKKRAWWPVFYDALPIINGMHMKDGYITRYRCFTGIHLNTKGQSFIFSLMVNNYNGSPAATRQKLWELLDLLK